jgi:hypothetical protein
MEFVLATARTRGMRKTPTGATWCYSTSTFTLILDAVAEPAADRMDLSRSFDVSNIFPPKPERTNDCDLRLESSTQPNLQKALVCSRRFRDLHIRARCGCYLDDEHHQQIDLAPIPNVNSSPTPLFYYLFCRQELWLTSLNARRSERRLHLAGRACRRACHPGLVSSPESDAILGSVFLIAAAFAFNAPAFSAAVSLNMFADSSKKRSNRRLLASAEVCSPDQSRNDCA